MQRGHPYRNEALDERRAEQRRFLREVPNNVVEKVKPVGKLTVGGGAGLAEVLLRDLAAENIAKLDPKLTAVLSEHTRAEHLYSTIRSADEDTVIRDFYVEGAKARRDENPLPTLSEAEESPYRQISRLLAWADLLADDGYIDPRLIDTNFAG